MKKVYLSPSKQPANIYYDRKHTEELVMNWIVDAMVSFLSKYDVQVLRGGKDQDLVSRATEANREQVDYYFAIHSNAGGGVGCEVFYQVGVDKSADVKTKSKSYANKVNTELSAITPLMTKVGDRGIKFKTLLDGRDWNNELRNTKVPANLVEIEFHDTKAGSEWILNNIQLIAETMSKSIVEMLGVTLKPMIPVDDFFFVQTGAFKTLADAEIEAAKIAKSIGKEVGVKYGSKFALKWIKGIK
jgi:N-acetylmuramoyl-L-alanine amidase